MRSLADGLIAVVITVLAGAVVLEWAWHLIEPILPVIGLLTLGITVIRVLGRRYFF